MNHYFKPKKRCTQVCQEHQFVLNPIRNECWIKSAIHIDYCPIINEFTGQYENIIPTLNNDRQPCLPAFILEVDKTQYQFNLERYQYEHQVKIDEVLNKKNKMLVPKPGKKHRYCGVCKKNYDEYMDHIQSPEHIVSFHAFRSVNLIKTLIVVCNHEFQEQKNTNQSSILFCDSNTRMPMTKENFGAYFDQERIGMRFQKQLEIPPCEYKIPQAKRGRPKKTQNQPILKKVKQEDPPIIPHYHPNYMDFYYMQQQYLQAQQQIYHPYYPQQQQYYRDCMNQIYNPLEVQYFNQNFQLDQQFNQRMLQQQHNFSQLRENEDRRECSDRSQLWQRLIQLANTQNSGQPQQNDIVQLVHSIIESYENNPRYQDPQQPPQQQ